MLVLAIPLVRKPPLPAFLAASPIDPEHPVAGATVTITDVQRATARTLRRKTVVRVAIEKSARSRDSFGVLRC